MPLVTSQAKDTPRPHRRLLLMRSIPGGGGSTRPEHPRWGRGALLAVVCAWLLMSCSGNTDVNRGVFLDSAVEGMAYETDGSSGVTDSDGTFIFSSGDAVTFSIGGIVLGTTRARTTLTPIDLVPQARDADNPTVINMVRFLITLDADRDPSNGITVIPDIRDALSRASLSFTLPPDSFDTDPSMIEVMERVNETYREMGFDERGLTSYQDALFHFRATLETLQRYTPHDGGSSGGGGWGGGPGGG